jgi:hypothetical protein
VAALAKRTAVLRTWVQQVRQWLRTVMRAMWCPSWRVCVHWVIPIVLLLLILLLLLLLPLRRLLLLRGGA